MHPARQITCQSADSSPPTQTSTSEAQAETLKIELDTSEAQSSLRFCAVRAGTGKAIVVEAVAIESAAEAAGIRPGQQLLALSDPIRAEDVWTLNERASLRYVRDAIRMRRTAFIKLEITAAVLSEWQDLESATSASDTSDNEGEQEMDLLTAVAAEAAASMGSVSGSIDISPSTTPGTIGERLARKQSASNKGMNDLEKRKARRKEYFEQTTDRNDAPFFAGLLAAFVLPPLAILIYASQSGYLDSLAAGVMGR